MKEIISEWYLLMADIVSWVHSIADKGDNTKIYIEDVLAWGPEDYNYTQIYRSSFKI